MPSPQLVSCASTESASVVIRNTSKIFFIKPP
jgi:hypothetical protein